MIRKLSIIATERLPLAPRHYGLVVLAREKRAITDGPPLLIEGQRHIDVDSSYGQRRQGWGMGPGKGLKSNRQ